MITSLFLKSWEIWIINLKLIKFSCILCKYNIYTAIEVRRIWFTLKNINKKNRIKKIEWYICRDKYIYVEF